MSLGFFFISLFFFLSEGLLPYSNKVSGFWSHVWIFIYY